MDIMKFKVKLIALHVTQDVKLVQFIILVKLVKLVLTESHHQSVHVLMVCLKKISYVLNVPHNVPLVLITLGPVFPVLVTESDQKTDVLA
jgi:hypothetical protein